MAIISNREASARTGIKFEEAMMVDLGELIGESACLEFTLRVIERGCI